MELLLEITYMLKTYKNIFTICDLVLKKIFTIFNCGYKMVFLIKNLKKFNFYHQIRLSIV